MGISYPLTENRPTTRKTSYMLKKYNLPERNVLLSRVGHSKSHMQVSGTRGLQFSFRLSCHTGNSREIKQHVCGKRQK